MSDVVTERQPITVVLIRHGRSTANASGILAGRMPGVALDAKGVEQSQSLISALGETNIEFMVHSDLERTLSTVRPLATHLQIPTIEDARITECDYGDWSGRPLSELALEPLWTEIQKRPSQVTFPNGESMMAMQTRAVACVRDYVGQAQRAFAMCSHGDVIKAIIADAVGLELDKFQSIDVRPASISVLQYDSSGGARLVMQNFPVGENAFGSLSLESTNSVGGGDVSA